MAAALTPFASYAHADEEYDKLKTRLNAAMREYFGQESANGEKVGWKNRSILPTPEQSKEMAALRKLQYPRNDFQADFLAYAEKHKGHREAIEAWAMAATMSPCEMSDDGYIETAATTRSLERLRLDHASDPDIVLAMDVVRQDGDCLRFDSRMAFYNAIEERNKDREIVARSMLARADMLTYSQTSRGPLWHRRATAEQKAGDQREAEELLRKVVEDYPNTAAGKDVVGRFFRRKHLADGQTLPDIEGKDLNGKPIRLSQFRGRVVMIVFWASWCGPCMDRIPEERELAEKFADKPFTILGVNCDRTRDAFKEVMAKEALPWPNIFDGDPKTGPIVTSLRISAFPAVILLDHEGVIRKPRSYSDRLEKTVSDLLAKVPASKTPSTSKPAESPRADSHPAP